MRNKSIGVHLAYLLAGLAILAAAAIFAKANREAHGMLLTVPYIFIGIGAGIFGHQLDAILRIRAVKKNPQAAKQLEIEENDERNVIIRAKAKAKAYDLMVTVFGALMLALALVQADLEIILSFVGAYLFVVFSNIYFINKFSKEM